MIIQTNTFICDECHAVVSVSVNESLYSDPVIFAPEGWINSKNGDLYCPDCADKNLQHGRRGSNS